MADVDVVRARLVADRVTTTHAQDTARREQIAQAIYEAHPWVDYTGTRAVGTPRVVPWSELKTLARVRFLQDADAAIEAAGVPALVALVDARDAAIQAVLDLADEYAETAALHRTDAERFYDPSEPRSYRLDLAREADAHAGRIRAAVVSALDGNGQNT